MAPWHYNYYNGKWQRGGGGNWEGSQAQSWSQQGNGQGWTCQHKPCVENCRKDKKGPWRNQRQSQACEVCGTAWTAPSTVSLKDKLKAQLGGGGGAAAAVVDSKKSYAEVAGANGGVTTVEEMLWEEEADTCKAQLTDEYVSLARLLQHPQEISEDWTAVDTLERFLPKKNAKDQDKLAQELQDQQILLDLKTRQVIATSQEEIATAKKKIEATKKLLEAAKGDSAVALAASELDVSLKQFVRTEGCRVARFDVAAQNAEDRAERLEDICREQVTAWESNLAKIQAERSTREAAWLARRLLMAGRALETEELLNAKLAEAQQRSGVPLTASPPSVNLQLADAAAEMESVKKTAQEAAEVSSMQMKTLLDRIKALEANVATAPAAAAHSADPNEPARLQSHILKQCSLAIVYTIDELPAVKTTPDKDEKFHLALIQANLAHWSQAGLIPATFGNLVQGSHPKEAGSLAMMKALVGEQIWERFFLGKDMELSHFVPFQLGSILNTALARAETVLKKCVKDWDFTQQAQTHFSSLLEEDDNAKRARTGRYLPY